MATYNYQGNGSWKQDMPPMNNSGNSTTNPITSTNSGNIPNPMSFDNQLDSIQLGSPNFQSDFAQAMGQAYHTPQSNSPSADQSVSQNQNIPSLNDLLNPDRPKPWQNALAAFIEPFAIGAARGVQNIHEYGGFGRGMAAGAVEGFQNSQAQIERENQQETYLDKVFDKDPINQMSYAQAKLAAADPTNRPADAPTSGSFQDLFNYYLQKNQSSAIKNNLLNSFITQYGPAAGTQMFMQYTQLAHPIPAGYLPSTEVTYGPSGVPQIKTTSHGGGYAPLPPNVQPSFDINDMIKQKLAPYIMSGLNTLTNNLPQPNQSQQQPVQPFVRPGQ